MTDLSIIIPTYNRLSLLKETLDTFVGKLECRYEVIIVDDGSTDGTRDYLSGLQEPHRVFLNKHGGGNAARNTGLKAARGRYVKFVDDDDLLEPAAVDEQVALLDSDPQADLVYGEFVEWFTDTGERTVSQCGQVDDLLNALLSNWWCALFAYTIRRAAFTGLWWDETLTTNQDTDFVLRLAARERKWTYVPLSIGDYRRHDHLSVSRLNFDQRRRGQFTVWKNVERLLRTEGRLTTRRRLLLGQRYHELAEHLCKTDRATATRIIIRVLAVYPRLLASRRTGQLVLRLGLGNTAAVGLVSAAKNLYRRQRH